MLLENDIKEHLALAYVYTVASRAGCSTEFIRVDRDSIDITVTHVDREVGPDDVREGIIGIQIKAHAHDPMDGPIQYYLNSTKNFDDLRRPHTLFPRLLVVVLLPKDEAQWVHLSEDALVLRRCGYWMSLVGATERSISIPRHNVFDGQSLMRILDHARRREVIR